MVKRFLGTTYPIFIFFVVNLGGLSLSRLGLGLWQAERISASNGWLSLFLQGIRVDISTLCWLFSPAIALSLVGIWRSAVGFFIKKMVQIYLVVVSVFLIFMELATPAFINTYDFRPNRLFVEYLVSPKEVFTMLAYGHLVAMIFALSLSVLAIWAYSQLAKRTYTKMIYPRLQWRPVAFLVIGTITFLGARSTLQHRGLNPAMVAFSSDALVNSLVLNSGYSVLFAIQQMKDEASSAELYGKLPLEEVIAILKEASYRPDKDYISAELPTLTRNLATYKGKPKNLVILLEESFGAQFVGILGGEPLSPNFDRLAKEGWLFENLYASGTRTVRGIEATIAGFTPTPARSVVKLPGSQHNFFTIAQFLKEKGYSTNFVFGGAKNFDNMASFFYGNGFENIIDEAAFTHAKFSGTWGASDEDVFDKANETFEQLAKENKPFLGLVLSSSNHDPFEFPEGKIELYEQPKATRNNSAKYADYAIGHFFDLAKKSAYWKDTIFLVIADHDSRVYGASLVPVKHFHIPALILGEGIQPRRDDRLVSQIDMPPTLLSLVGVSGDYPMLGYDLTHRVNPNRALMQFDKNLAYMEGNQVVILQPNQISGGYKYDKSTGNLTPTKMSEKQHKRALSYALWGSYAYQKGLYRLLENQTTQQ